MVCEIFPDSQELLYLMLSSDCNSFEQEISRFTPRVRKFLWELKGRFSVWQGIA